MDNKIKTIGFSVLLILGLLAFSSIIFISTIELITVVLILGLGLILIGIKGLVRHKIFTTVALLFLTLSGLAQLIIPSPIFTGGILRLVFLVFSALILILGFRGLMKIYSGKNEVSKYLILNKIDAFGNFLISWGFILNFLGAILVPFLINYFLMDHMFDYTRHDVEQEMKAYYGMKGDQAVKELESEGLVVNVDSVYIDGYEPGTVVFQEPLPSDSSGMMVKKDRNVTLLLQSVIPPGKEIPNVIDLSRRMAEEKLKSRSLVVKIKTVPNDGKYVLDLLHEGKSLKNADNDIAPGTKLPPKSVVTLVVGEGAAQNVLVPDLMGMTITEASKRLSNASLIVNYAGCETCETEEDSLSAVVIKQIPVGGGESAAPSGSDVTIWFGTQKAINDGE